MGPLLLRADNFTPPSRTPWGGYKLLSRYKAGCPVAAEQAAYGRVGESWEISAGPEFPSRAADGDEPLSEIIARDPVTMLGPAVAAVQGSTALLVKLLDAADDLSVQIHPADDYAGLAHGEAGKPESWYVLEADPDAGIYLGLRTGVTRESMARALAEGADVSTLLDFVPVAPGDFFLLEAGTPHAIGRGVTLVEPQHVAPGRRGVTYRYWDWNRRYDESGRPDPRGEPRTLHVGQALDVTAWDAPREAALRERVSIRAGAPALDEPARLEHLAGPEGPVASSILRVARLVGGGRVTLGAERRLRGLTVVAGRLRVHAASGSLEIGCGRSAIFPANLEAEVELDGAHAILTSAD